jgi:hypothetical protein
LKYFGPNHAIGLSVNDWGDQCLQPGWIMLAIGVNLDHDVIAIVDGIAKTRLHGAADAQVGL